MNWYKINHGLPFDSKLAVVARRAGFRRGEALALWVALLDHASRATPRGSVEGIDAEEISVALEFDAAMVETVLQAFRDRNMILPGGRIADWERSQKLSTPRTTRARQTVRLLQETEEESSLRRQRLQEELLARHKKRGRVIADAFNPHTPEMFP
jgi:hypothetical protein